MVLRGLGPLGLLITPTLLIFASVLSLAQFKIAYVALERFSSSRHPLLLDSVQPVLKKLVQVFESVLGSPSGFNPTLTHVLLVALILAVLSRR
ncbi:hypothetical protein APUTEX25_000272 [Auxenochlorella protothecoides]|uniref:Uncharacterized protein n=1 Tax=Auxenochlorella protothecoides TaxID=3075 RepID=A0A3M7L0H8_AUXPR|nr:hypothetical protein APUTEX25_000272 [Auxenochlorella protothecoides]|eukprot:RMZ55689.1 hypothetical protein APUTEX25_000272 [Auxenochlorella protothecoides]